MRYSITQLKNFLLDTGLVSGKELDEAERTAHEKNVTIGDILIGSGKFVEDDFRKVEAHLLGVPFVDLKGGKIDPKILSIIPEPVARKHNIVAYKKTDDKLEVAMLDPQDIGALELIKKSVNYKIYPRLTDVESIKGVLTQYRKSLSAEFGDLIQKQVAVVKTVATKKASPKNIKIN